MTPKYHTGRTQCGLNFCSRTSARKASEENKPRAKKPMMIGLETSLGGVGIMRASYSFLVSVALRAVARLLAKPGRYGFGPFRRRPRECLRRRFGRRGRQPPDQGQ